MHSKNDPMKAYMQDIGEIPLISKEEEVELAARIRKGDLSAREKLIKANLRLVVKIAHDFKGFGLPLLDLISEGNIGLMRAAEKFDPAKGAKFSSYSAWWIKQSMRRALSQKSRTIRVPVASAGKINKIKTAKLHLADKLGRSPTDVEIAEHLDLTKRTVQGLKLADFKTFSLHDPIQKGEEGSFEEIIPDGNSSTPDTIIEDSESIKRLRGLINNLDERERTILVMRYGLDGARPKTLEEVSRTIGRTRERVRQIQMQSLKKLRALIEDNSLDNEGHEVEQQAHPGGRRRRGTPSGPAALAEALSSPTGLHGLIALRRQGRGKNALGASGSSMLAELPLAHGNIKQLTGCEAGLSALQMSTRSLNSLRSAGISTIGELVCRSPDDLLSIRYFGEKCMMEVLDALAHYCESMKH
jgi:RNA polymerase primary sigma factor